MPYLCRQICRYRYGATYYRKCKNTANRGAFGDWVALSDVCDELTASLIAPEVSDGVIAPGYTDEALAILKAKRKGGYNVVKIDPNYVPDAQEHKQIFGITFEQGRNNFKIGEHLLQNIVTANKELPESAKIDCSNVTCTCPDPELVKKMRASYYLMGALLGRFGKAHVALPGGCNFASRPIDQHIKGFEALGAEVEETDEYVKLSASANGLQGNRVCLDIVSVGATVNIMIAAVLMPGQTVIENAAKEPHIVDLANFLNTMGARISGAGTDTIRIRGVDALTGGTYAIIPDQIEAGTYMAADRKSVV